MHESRKEETNRDRGRLFVVAIHPACAAVPDKPARRDAGSFESDAQ